MKNEIIKSIEDRKDIMPPREANGHDFYFDSSSSKIIPKEGDIVKTKNGYYMLRIINVEISIDWRKIEDEEDHTESNIS